MPKHDRFLTSRRRPAPGRSDNNYANAENPHHRPNQSNSPANDLAKKIQAEYSKFEEMEKKGAAEVAAYEKQKELAVKKGIKKKKQRERKKKAKAKKAEAMEAEAERTETEDTDHVEDEVILFQPTAESRMSSASSSGSSSFESVQEEEPIR